MNQPSLELLLRALKLPAFAEHCAELGLRIEKEGLSFDEALRRLAELELESRRRHKVQRLQRESQLPTEKTLHTLNLDRLPVKVRHQVPALCQGDFLDRAENILAFGLPGRGKTHLVCAIGHELVQRGRSVLFLSTGKLVERLLGAKRDLALEDELKALDRFDAVILDDIGYVQQSREEMEVLFTFLAERYERRSVLITSNLVFSQWGTIFKDPMTTAAAIDRVVHHAVILDLTGKSKRAEDALARDGTSLPQPAAP